MHVQLEAHQPQDASAVQASQEELSLQGSVTTQALGTHRQSSHEPDVGPVLEPLSHW